MNLNRWYYECRVEALHRILQIPEVRDEREILIGQLEN